MSANNSFQTSDAIRIEPWPRASDQRRLSFSYRHAGKRLFDIIFALAILVPVSLTVLVLAAAMWAIDRKSPFYTQKRVGLNGRLFVMWKLRSMVPNADKHLSEILERDPQLRAEWNSKQKLTRDPPITKFGQFLRKTSLDELPQLWNVIRGDMSLVGPRPMLPEQRSMYSGSAYYRLRPGITGIWQVLGRSRENFECRSDYDEVYDDKLSFATDISLILRTVKVVVRGTGC